MDIVLERGIARCFPEEWLQKIVHREFLKCEDQQKVDKLAMMAIKSIMHKELMKDELDVYSQYIYKLIFKELIDPIEDFCERGPIGKFLKSQSDGSGEIDIRKAHYHRLLSDGPMMFAIMSQRMSRLHRGTSHIIVTRKTLQIRLNFQNMAEIAHRDDLEYDTYWAEKFTKLLMSKFSVSFFLEMNGEELPADQFNREYMFNFLNTSILDKLPRMIPAEGWEEYISEEKPVYMLSNDGFDRTNYIFIFAAEIEYSDTFRRSYWGYLSEE